MANICTNLFFCSTENKENLKTVENYMTDTFGKVGIATAPTSKWWRANLNPSGHFPKISSRESQRSYPMTKRFICGFFPMNSAMSMRVSGCIETENGILNSNIL